MRLQLRNKPVCQRCNKQHWNMVPCEDADARERVEEHNERRRANVLVTRPREGFLEFGDRLASDTERIGRGTFGLRRQPGERPGSLRSR